MSLYEFEHAKRAELGIKYICGVDEAGRGPLAGPVFAAAVILPEDFEIEGLNDSKKLSEKKRDLLFDEIIEHALAYSIKSIDHKTIDEINILEATMLAMKTAVENLSIKPERVFRRKPCSEKYGNSGGICYKRRCNFRKYCGGFHSRKSEQGQIYARNG